MIESCSKFKSVFPIRTCTFLGSESDWIAKIVSIQTYPARVLINMRQVDKTKLSKDNSNLFFFNIDLLRLKLTFII